MAELFASFADFKTNVGGAVNQSLKIESLAPTIYETGRLHIVPWLGLTYYQFLVAGSGLTGNDTALLPYVKRALAQLTMYEYSKVGGVEFSESGMHRIETDSRKSAYRYQEREYRDDMREKGYNALEDMLLFLDTNKANYATWAASDEGLAHRTPLLNYAKDFRLLMLPDCDRFTYEAIRPIINSVESMIAPKIFPAAFWSGVSTRHLAGTLTTAEKVVRRYLRLSIGHKAIEEAIRQRWIQVTNGRVGIAEDFGDQRNTNLTMPTSTGSGLYITHDVWSDRFICEAIEYMRANPTLFPTAFDVASGGTSTATDAWHINTVAEQEEADTATVSAKKAAAVYHM